MGSSWSHHNLERLDSVGEFAAGEISFVDAFNADGDRTGPIKK
jgi:hypothetical protein